MNQSSFLFQILAALLLLPWCANAQDLSVRRYDIGSPVLQDIWVNPSGGNDAANGLSRAQAVRTVIEAWRRIPQSTTLTTGYRILLTAGLYPRDTLPNYWELRWGSAGAPIVFQAADGRGTAVLQGDINAFDIRYVYFIDFNIDPQPAGDAFHCEQCNHILLRGMDISGGNRQAHETVKVNQSQHLYIEDCDIHGSYENNIDYVAVQYGHIIGNKIHQADDWCAYVKGGSAQIVVEANEIYDCGTGGFTAGQGSGFEFLTAPWIHYEASDIKFVNNIVHDTTGAGFGVNGGFDILFAYNTLYRVGSNSHAIEVVYGFRSCDGDPVRCGANLSAGGWGTGAVGTEAVIPNRNVFIYNNVLYNPAGFQSRYAHFSIQGPRASLPGSNLPATITTDTNLQIRGNVLWNGPADLSLGIEDSDQGCQPGNTACNAAQLRADNAINTIEPQLVSPSAGNFRPVAAGNLFRAAAFAIPAFPGNDRPSPPLAPLGVLANGVARDYANLARTTLLPAGAYAGPVRPRRAANGYLEWNGFLGMVNIAELVNTGSTPVSVTLSLYDSAGNAIAQTVAGVPALGQRDIVLNGLAGFQANNYGIATLDYAGDSLTVRMTYYRPAALGSSFDFAYSKPMSAPLTGSASVSFNTFQPSLNPSEFGLPVTNWLSIANLDPSRTLGFTVNRYNQAGMALGSQRIAIAPFGRFDLEGGHQNPGTNFVGLNEVVPDNPSAPYFVTLVRYGLGGNGDRFAFAYPLAGSAGAAGAVYAPVSTGGGAQNWVEVVNSDSAPLQVQLQFFSQTGQALGSEQVLTLTARGQTHVNASSVVGANASGILRVTPGRPGALLAHSLFYFFGGAGGIDSMYGARAMAPAGTAHTGSYNLFLGMYNWLKVANTNSAATSVRVLVHGVGDRVHEEQFLLAPHATIELPMHDFDRFGTSANSYGLVEVEASGITSQMLRIRPDMDGFDFVFPTEIR